MTVLDLQAMADEMRHELFLVGDHSALGVDRVMVERWLHGINAELAGQVALVPSYDDWQINKKLTRCLACGTPYYMTAPGLCIPCRDAASRKQA